MSKIYALSDDLLTPPESIFLQTIEILRGGVKMLQYRSKRPQKDERLIASLVSLCEDYGAQLIINDDAVLAKKLGAHGVHIGAHDGDAAQIRAFLGSKAIIGVSCYASADAARAAQAAGAGYVAFGSMFASPTKPAAPICPHEIVVKVREILNIPIAVIGGINSTNLSQILPLKPDYIALVSAIYKPASITQNLKNLKDKIDEYI